MSRPVFDAALQRFDEGDRGWFASRAHGPSSNTHEPVELGGAGFEGASPLASPPDSEKARSATGAAEELTLGWRRPSALDPGPLALAPN